MKMISTANNGNDVGGSSRSGDGASVVDFHDQMHHKDGGGGGGDNDAHLKKGPWTAEEDAILMEYVRKHGEGNWNAVQRHSGLARCGKSCRLRWANHLRPNLKKGAFSPEEERLIVELHAKFGNKWARMATVLPGRTDNEIKNYWNTRIKRHQRQGLPLYPPDIQPQNPPSPHFNHHHHYKSPPISIPTTPPSSFTFQTHHFPSPTTPTHHHHHTPPLSPTTTSTSVSTPPFDFSQAHHLHHHNHNSYSLPSTPTSSFSFQTVAVTSSTPPPLSPLSSPSTTPTTNFPSFDFNMPRSPPVLQTPMRFKRFSSSPGNNVPFNVNTNCQYSMPVSPLLHASAPNTSPMGGHQMPTCFASGGNGGSSSDFHNEIHKENQEMCSLLAAVRQQELPSNQVVLPNNQNRNMGIGIATAGCKFGKKVAKKRIVKDKFDGKLEFALEDLLQEAKLTTECGQTFTDQNSISLQEQKFISEGFDTNWDLCDSHALSLGYDSKLEIDNQLIEMPEDLTKVLNNLPSSMQPELYSDSGDISNGQSVVTDDNIGFEMQQLASLFPPSDHSRTLGSCSWDNLPGIC